MEKKEGKMNWLTIGFLFSAIKDQEVAGLCSDARMLKTQFLKVVAGLESYWNAVSGCPGVKRYWTDFSFNVVVKAEMTIDVPEARGAACWAASVGGGSGATIARRLRWHVGPLGFRRKFRLRISKALRSPLFGRSVVSAQAAGGIYQIKTFVRFVKVFFLLSTLIFFVKQEVV